jgi:CMP-N,N'-diacetyllegionaminic acid synthase
MKILAIIPARGGSKGIPHKNMRKICGKPLIEYTINTAKSSKLINKIILTTDSKKIAEFSKSKGIEVPFLRPKKISTSNSSTIDVINHTVDFLKKHENYLPDIITILQPTSPLRTVEILDKSIKSLKNSSTSSSILGVSEVKNHPFLCFQLKNSFLKPVKSNFKTYSQRQKFPIFYYPTGSIYTFWHKTLQNTGNIYGSKIKPLIINVEDSIDIDTPYDLFQAEMRFKNWNKFMRRYRNKKVN